MSTNHGIWRKASRLSEPRLLWRVLPLPAKACVLVSMGSLLLLLGARLPWAQAAQHFHERQAERAGLAPLVAEAERLNLTFPEVVVSYPAHLGKPVYWPVSVISTSTTRVQEHPAWLIVWTNPERVHDDQVYSTKVLARVAAVRGDAVYLDYLGRP